MALTFEERFDTLMNLIEASEALVQDGMEELAPTLSLLKTLEFDLLIRAGLNGVKLQSVILDVESKEFDELEKHCY